jgi:two-component system, LytTR family, response regulator
MLRAIVIDDEAAGIKTLRILSERNSGAIRLVAHSQVASEGIRLIEDYEPDVVFLDISMPELTGFELLSKLSFRGFKLVFTTAHKEYAIEAIREQAFDYLLKPISDIEFRQCIDKLLKDASKNKTEETKTFVELQVKDGVLYLRQKDIVRLEAARNYTEFYMDNGTKYISSKNLKEFEIKMDMNVFYRCHKSHIINLQKVQKFVNHEGFYALMNDGSKPEVSRNLKDAFLSRLKNV